MNVLLISPSYASERNAQYFPLGLASISAFLKQKGHQVSCLNLNNYNTAEGLLRLESLLLNRRFDVVGAGGLSMVLGSIESILNTTRRIQPDMITIIGGGMVTADPFPIFNYLKPTFAVIGEGEETTAELLAAINTDTATEWANIRGIMYWDEGVAKKTEDRPAIPDLQCLPSPDMDGFGIHEFLDFRLENTYDYHLTIMGTGRFIPVSASRSCPYKCTFCFHPVTQVYRKLPPDRTVEDILILKEKYNVDFFAIYDELFDYDVDRIKVFCAQLIARNANIKWTCQLRVNKVNRDLLRLMKQTGCVWISYGFESGSTEILTSMKKRIRPTDIKKAVELTREANIAIQANFLYGDPAETLETVEETLAFKNSNQLYFIDWSAVIPYPGTQLFQSCLEKGLITDSIAFTKTISNSATYLWNTVQPPVNMTNMKDEAFRQLYLELRESNETSHRKQLAIVDEIQAISHTDFLVKLCCPSCQDRRQYTLVYPPDRKTGMNLADLPFFGIRGLNVLCMACHRKMHFSAWFFPDIDTMHQRFQDRLDSLASKEAVVLLPAMDRYFVTFSQRIDLSKLEVSAALDSRSFRQGQQFFSQNIQPLLVETIHNYRDRTFVILPAANPKLSKQSLLDAGIQENRIIAFHDGFQSSYLESR